MVNLCCSYNFGFVKAPSENGNQKYLTPNFENQNNYVAMTKQYIAALSFSNSSIYKKSLFSKNCVYYGYNSEFYKKKSSAWSYGEKSTKECLCLKQ